MSSENYGNKSLLQYVLDFCTKLDQACELARKNLEVTQRKMKSRYDTKIMARRFNPGDRVIVLLIVPYKQGTVDLMSLKRKLVM